jgi:hypothetical protein
MGGKDTVDNLELIDMDVYVNLCGQAFERLKDVPIGTRITGVELDKDED